MWSLNSYSWVDPYGNRVFKSFSRWFTQYFSRKRNGIRDWPSSGHTTYLYFSLRNVYGRTLRANVLVKGIIYKYVIRTSISPWGAPNLFVINKDGPLHIFINYRQLNQLTIKNKYPIARIYYFFDKHICASYFSKIDLHFGYHQLRVKENDILKMDFKTQYDHYEFLFRSFVLMYAPTIFMELINRVFTQYLNMFLNVFIDDKFYLLEE